MYLRPVVRQQQPHRGTLDLQSTEEQYHNQHKQNNSEKEHKTQI